MARIAWVAVIDQEELGFTLGVAEEGTKGYSPLDEWHKVHFDSYDQAAEEAERRNEALGLTRTEAFKLVASTMTFNN